MEKDLSKTRNDLIDVLIPSVIENPPDELRSGIQAKKPSKEIVRKYLNDVLSKVIPSADDFLQEMKLYYDFKDVTYEMLNDEEFQNKLREQYPYVNWPKPYEEKEVLQEKKISV